MKAIIPAALLLLASESFTMKADEYRGQKTMGVFLGYIDHNRSAITGIEYTYRFSRRFRIAPDASYVVQRNYQDALILNINGQFLHGPELGQWEIFPYTGINYTSWTMHEMCTPPGLSGTPDISSRVSRLGLNLGGGGNLNITDQLQLGLRAGYSFVKDYSTFTMVAKIAYRF